MKIKKILLQGMYYTQPLSLFLWIISHSDPDSLALQHFKYGIDNVWGISRTFYSYIADTYYPSLAQFGVIGLCLYISFWIYIIHTAYKYFTTIKDAKLITLILLIVGYFAIESTSDSTYTTHRGFFIMMILGLVLSNMKHQSLLKKEDKNESITN